MTSTQSSTPPSAERARLRRHTDEKMLGGVAAGVARHFDFDVSLVRLAFVALALFGGSGLVLYIVAWVVVPADDPSVAEAAADPAVVPDVQESEAPPTS